MMIVIIWYYYCDEFTTVNFGIDSIILKSKHEDLFKYKDYLLGTGRNEFSFVENIEDALESNPIAKLKIDFPKIIGSFPYHLYK